MDIEAFWLKQINTLKVDKARGDPAPHKPLLLLVVFDLAEERLLEQEILALTGELAFRFCTYWTVGLHGNFAWLVLATASVEEPGEKMIGATFEQEFPKEGVLTAKVTEYTPPKNNKGADLADVETKGLYKVVFSDGDFGQYYYSDLLKHGAKVPVDGNSEL